MLLPSSWPDNGIGTSQNVASLNILVHDMINLLYYEHWTGKQKYFYLYFTPFSSVFIFDCEHVNASWLDLSSNFLKYFVRESFTLRNFSLEKLPEKIIKPYACNEFF